MTRPPTDEIEAFLCAHLDVDAAPAAASVARLGEPAARYLLFGAGRLRLALLSADVAAVTTEPEPGCDYLAPAWAVPERYRALAAVAVDERSFVHLAGTRFGLGPCRAEGDVVLSGDAITRCPPALAGEWIAGTVAEPACLVLDRAALCRRLHGLRAAGAAS